MDKYQLVRARGFSSLSEQDAVDILKVSKDCLAHKEVSTEAFGDILKNLAAETRVKLDDIPDRLLQTIVDQLQQEALTLSTFWDSGNEATRNYFVKAVLSPIINHLKQSGKCKAGKESRFHLAIEHPVVASDSDYRGPVEFVVMYQQLYLFITEVKESDVRQGIVQNLFQLLTAFEANEIKFGVFGCVTTAATYQLIYFDGDKFIISNQMMLLKGTTDSNKSIFQKDVVIKSLQPIANLLYILLQIELHNASPPGSPS